MRSPGLRPDTWTMIPVAKDWFYHRSRGHERCDTRAFICTNVALRHRIVLWTPICVPLPPTLLNLMITRLPRRPRGNANRTVDSRPRRSVSYRRELLSHLDVFSALDALVEPDAHSLEAFVLKGFRLRAKPQTSFLLNKEIQVHGTETATALVISSAARHVVRGPTRIA